MYHPTLSYSLGFGFGLSVWVWDQILGLSFTKRYPVGIRLGVSVNYLIFRLNWDREILGFRCADIDSAVRCSYIPRQILSIILGS